MMPNEDPRTPADLVRIPLAQATRILPRRADGRRINYAKLWRWASKGRQGIRLKTETIAGRPHTTARWVRHFVSHGRQ